MEITGLPFDRKKSQILNQITEEYLSIEKTLIRRGYSFKSNKSDLSNKLLIEFPIFNPAEQADKFFKIMDKTINRSMLKKICSLKHRFSRQDLIRRWKISDVDRLLSQLIELGAIKEISNRAYIKTREHAEYGENLEWYIAELLQKQFYGICDWGVHISDAPAGGDYDVLARLENDLIYVECKSKKPENIEEKELLNFLRRDEFLRPYISIFFVDTTDEISHVWYLLDNISKKIKKICDVHQKEINFVIGNPPYFGKLNKSIICFENRLFCINASKSVKEIFKFCFRHRYRTGELDQAYKGRFWLHELLIKCDKWWNK